MENLATYLLVSGMLCAIFGQFYSFTLLLKKSGELAILALVVPGFAYFIARRHGIYWKVLSPYLIGIALLVAGAIAAN
jgi:hypothetical protein